MATQQQDFFTKLGRKPVIFVQGAGGITGIEVVKGVKARLGTSDQFTIVASVCKTDDQSILQLRSMSGVEVLPFDLHDKELTNRVFGLNIQKLVVIPPFTADRVDCVTSFTDRAYQSGVKQLVLLSVLGADTDANEFFHDMKLIQNKIRSYKEDFNWTILGTAIHMECFEDLTPKLKQGALTIPLLGDKKIPPICSCDIGKFAAKVLLDGGCERKICELTGPELLSGNDLAKIFSNTLGRAVQYTSVPPQEFRNLAYECKMTDVKIKSLQNLFDWYNSGQGNRTSNEYERVMGTKPASFTEFVKEHLACFQ